MYARDSGGAYPDEFTQLEKYFSPKSGRKAFVTPKNRKNVGQWADVMEWTDYVYIPGTTTSSSPDRVVAFLPPGHHTQRDENGALILFADNHVEWQTVKEFTRTINETPKKSTVPTGARERAPVVP